MSKTRHYSRRDFLRTSRNTLIAVGAGAVMPSIFLNRTKAATGENPSEFIRVGFIGVGGQGNSNLGAIMKNAVALCDVDKKHLADTAKKVETKTGRKCATYGDFRKMLESKELDAILISTPDHWHALPAALAMEAGKDVYCEKPLTLTIAEGQTLLKLARKHKKVFQTGSQQRSDGKFRVGCQMVRDGKIGKIKTVNVGLPGVNWSKEPLGPDSEPPADLDYDMWLGPAPFRPYNKLRVHYYFRFFWDYSGGQMTNWGAHHLDITQWALGMDESGPVQIEATSEADPEKRFETPPKFKITYTYDNGTKVICESPGKRMGSEFIGEKGKIYVNRGALESDPENLAEEALTALGKAGKGKSHHQNWLDCIKTRENPICDVAIGHRSATVCHLGNIAVRTGKTVKWDPKKEEIVGDAELAKWATKAYRAPWKLPEA